MSGMDELKKNPFGATIMQAFMNVYAAMNRCELIAKRGAFSPEVKGVDGRAVQAGPVDVAREMKSLREYLDQAPGHGVDLVQFGHILKRWNHAAQIDEMPAWADFELDRNWFLRYGRS